MATTAVITRPAQTQFIAGLTQVQFSGLDSYKTVASPADGWTTIALWSWNFGDGTTGDGAEVSHNFLAAGNYVVTLTVTADDGTTNSTTSNVTVAAEPAWARIRYVKAGGNDALAGTNDTNAWATLERAFDDWRGSGLQNTANWGLILVKAGDTIPFAGLSDGTHSTNPDYGKVVITKYGAGANPVVSISNGIELDLDANNHDNSFNNPVFWVTIDFSWPSPQDPGAGGGKLQLSHNGSQISGGVIANGKIEILGGSGGMGMFDCTLSHSADVGVSVSGGGSHIMLSNVVSSANGSNNPLDHQFYISGCSYVGIVGCTGDQTGATDAYAALKISGTQKFYVRRFQAKASIVGIDLGANSDQGQQTSDGVIDAPEMFGVTKTGFYLNWLDRVSCRNPRGYGGMSEEVIKEQSYTDPGAMTPQFVANFTLIGGSFYHPGGSLLQCFTSWFTKITVKATICSKDTGTGYMVILNDAADISRLAFDGNCSFIGGHSAGSAGFALLGATDHTYIQWKATDNLDHAGQWNDPGFSNPSGNDLSLALGSPCIDLGMTLGLIVRDAVGVTRPQGLAYDMGALEYVPPTGIFSGATIASDQVSASFAYDATYGAVCTEIRNLEDGTVITPQPASLFRLVLRTVQASDSFITLDASDASSFQAQTLGYDPGSFHVGSTFEQPGLGGRHWFQVDFYFTAIGGGADALKVSLVASILDAMPDRILFTLYFDPQFGNGLGSHGIFWAAPVVLELSPFASSHYLLAINGGIVTRNPTVDLVGNGSTYRFLPDVGFEPETKGGAQSDRMEVFYPENASSAVAAYGDRGRAATTVYLHDNLHFLGRRMIDTYANSRIVLEHQGLIENGIAATNGWSFSSDADLRSVQTYVRVFKATGQLLGEEVGIDYARWRSSSVEGRAILPAKDKDRADMATLPMPPLWMTAYNGDDYGESGTLQEIVKELRMAIPAIGDTIPMMTYGINVPPGTAAEALNAYKDNVASYTHGGVVGDSVPDLYDVKVDAGKITYCQTLASLGILRGGYLAPRRPTPYDGVGIWATDAMDAMRVQNHLEAADPGSYKTTDQWLKVTRTVASMSFDGTFTRITLSAGALDPSLWNIFTSYNKVTAGVDHLNHTDHLGFIQRDTLGYAFTMERQSQSDFTANPPIIYVAGDRTATVSAGHTVNLFFMGLQFLPGYDSGVSGRVGDNPSTSLCAMADDYGAAISSPASGWGIRFLNQVVSFYRPWGALIGSKFAAKNLVCWSTHHGEVPGSNAQVIALRRIFALLRASLAQPFSMFESDGPYDWLVGLVDGYEKTSIVLSLTTAIGSWGSSPFFQTAWGAWHRAGFYANAGAAHVTNIDAHLGIYNNFYEIPSGAKTFREAMVSDFFAGKLMTYAPAPYSPDAVGVRPDGALAYTPFYAAGYGLTVSSSFGALLARLMQFHMNFSAINVVGHRVRSMERKGTGTVVTNLQLLALLDGHNLPATELGLNRAPLYHWVMRDPSNPRRLVALFCNPRTVTAGDSFVFHPSWYSDLVPLGADGFEVTTYEVNVAGVVPTDVGFFHGDKAFSVTLPAGGMTALVFDFNSGLRFVYAYDDQDLREVPIPAGQTRVTVGDLSGSGIKLIYGFKNDVPDQNFKISAMDLRIVKQGQAEST